ncbi:MAG: hypothetical protein DRP96_07070, partial [Candidatus Neomarinimicrobiota bacterium]
IDSISVFLSVEDDSNLVAESRQTVTILPVNDPPDVPRTLTYNDFHLEDVPFNLDLEQFSNQIHDVETPFNQLSLELFQGKNIHINNHSGYLYTLQGNKDWNGKDTLSLNVGDDSCAVVTHVPIMIQPVNDIPIIAVIPDTSFNEDDSLIIDLHKYITDIDTPEDSLGIKIITDDAQSILFSEFDTSRWQVVLKGAPDGFIKDARIVYQVWDTPESYASDTQYVSILPVNDPPVITGLPDTSYYEDEQLTWSYSSILNYVHDVDNENSELTLTIETDSGAVFIEDVTDGSYFRFYSPKDNDSYGYLKLRITDPEEASCYQSFMVDIIPVNDAPVCIAVPDTNVAQNKPLIIRLETLFHDIDNTPNEMSWDISAVRSQVSMSGNMDSLICQPPIDFVGWDTINVEVTDPGMLSDSDTFRVHFDDTVPPEFTIGVFQNPIASEHINLYCFPNEPVDTIRSIWISGTTTSVEMIDDINPHPYYTHYQLSGNTNQQIYVTGTDTSGNTGQSDYYFSVSYLSRRNGGNLFSPDSTVQIIMGEKSISSDMFVLCLPNASDSNMTREKTSIILAKSSTLKRLDVDYTFQAPQKWLNKTIKILFYPPGGAGFSTVGYPGIFRYENGDWFFLKTYTDEKQSVYWSYTDRLGRYSLTGNAPQAPETLPTKVILNQNYPNPFNNMTTFQFELPELSDGKFEAQTSLIVYNILGQRVATIVNRTMVPGYYSIYWSSLNNSGNDIASGIYFYVLSYGHHLKTKKMVLLK